ncbi:MAG: efflux RND transporter periplasmic adaptor subunit [Bdellovibrionota bacterium]
MEKTKTVVLILTAVWLTICLARAGLVSGVIMGERSVLIKARSQGELTSIAVEEGKAVQKGDLLAVIDDQQEKLDIESARIEFVTAEESYKNSKKIGKYISKEEMTKIKNDYLKKKSVYEMKKISLSNKQITASISGVVAKRYHNRGDTISSGDKLFDIVQLEDLYVDVYVEPADIKKFSTSQEVTLKTDQKTEQVLKATVSFISPIVDPGSGTIKVRATIKNRKLSDGAYELRPGLIVTIEY